MACSKSHEAFKEPQGWQVWSLLAKLVKVFIYFHVLDQLCLARRPVVQLLIFMTIFLLIHTLTDGHFYFFPN